MLLPSGNDAAGAVAVELAGSETGFAVLMNKKARSLGMTDTNFVTASGLHDEAHYSTAYDMAVLTVAALQNQDFREICSQSKAQVSFGNPPYDRWLWNSNRLLAMEDTILGVKTGYTDEAGRCLVSACVRDGVTLICVTLNDPNDWQDHLALYEEGFARVTPVTVELPDSLMAEVSGGAKEMVSLSPTGRIIAGITGETVPTLVYQTTLNAYPLTAPLAEGVCVGSWTGYYQGRAVATGTLCTGEAVLQQSTERETEKPHSSKWKRLWKTIKEAFCAISCTGRLRIRS
jgi:D-alanyl-D-alanine carboxypeptidase/D-alanyl-D-alanine carboxypeptidase (penicillin-binding protein 5/6)